MFKGRAIKQWGSLEFDLLVDMVNNPQDKWILDNTKSFAGHIPNKGRPSVPADKTLSDLTQDLTPSPAREKSFGIIKSQLANLERS